MPITWVQSSPTVWVGEQQPYRAVATHTDDCWTARVEHGARTWTARITFHALGGAQAWAERKLSELVVEDPARCIATC
jgi:hypothetical protein